MYCSKCGKEIYENTVICPHCGVQLGEIDKPNIGVAFLGFLFPLIGFILYLVWHNKFPKKATSAINGTLIGIIIPLTIALLLIFVPLFNIISVNGMMR